MSRMQELSSATLGGAATAFFATPVEGVMIQQQRFGGSLIGTVARIATDFGVLSGGLMRGLEAAILRDAIYVSGLLGITPIMQDWLMETQGMSTLNAGLLASAVGGLVGAVPSHPLDVVKTCMQGDLERTTYTGYSSTYKALMEEGGVNRLFQGCFWRTFNIVATVFIANECRVRLAPVMFPHSVRGGKGGAME